MLTFVPSSSTLQLLRQLATLSSVYHKPPEMFVSRQRLAVQKATELQVWGEARTVQVDGRAMLWMMHQRAPLGEAAMVVLSLPCACPLECTNPCLLDDLVYSDAPLLFRPSGSQV